MFKLMDCPESHERKLDELFKKDGNWGPSLPLYSRVRLGGTGAIAVTRSGAATEYTYTFATGQVDAFSYALSQPLVPAGWPSSGSPETATSAHTNLAQPGKPPFGHFAIDAISIRICDTYMPRAAAQVLEFCTLRVVYGGDDGKLIGQPHPFAAGMGLFGASGVDYSSRPGTITLPTYHALSNGVPQIGSLVQLPPGWLMWWSDSSFDLKFRIKLERSVAVVGPRDLTENLTTPILGHTAPTAADFYFDLVVYLFGRRWEGS